MKKWTYLVAACMLAGTTPVLTGCIDNDEPAGIEQLRVAKSELIKAKAAVEAARVAEVQANAALLQAQAELEQAKARNQEAEAAINEAKAKQEEAKVELQNIQNEAERAKLEELIKEYEREQQRWEAEQAAAALAAENAQKEWELAYKQLEVEYEKALVELAKAKAELTEQQQKILAPYMTAVNVALEAYRGVADKVTERQRKLAKAIADVDVDEDFVQRQLAWDVKEAQSAKEGADEALVKANEELEEAKAIQASDFVAKQAALKEELNTLNNKIIELTVQAAEKTRSIYENEGVALMEMELSRQDYLAIEKTTPKFEIDLSSNVFPWSAYNAKVEIDEMEYTVDDMVNSGYAFNYALSTIESYLDLFKSWVRDENDNEWTAESISQLDYEIKELAADIQVKKDELKQALEAYQIGKYPTVDPSAFLGYDELVKAVESFNVQIKKYNDAVAANAASLKAINTAINETYPADEQAAWEAYDAAIVAADEAYATAIAALPKRIEEATALLESLDEALDKAEAALAYDPDNTILQNDVNEAEKAVEDQQKVVDALRDGTEQTRIEAARETAYGTAATNRETALKAAEDKRDATIKAENDKMTANNTAMAEAQKQLDDVELPATKKAFAVYEESATKIDDSSYYYGILSFAASQIDDATSLTYKDGLWVMTSLDAEAMTKLDRDALQMLIYFRAQKLYGSRVMNGYGDFAAQIVDMTTEDVIEKVDAIAAEEELIGNAYFNEYNNYGLLGQQAKKEQQKAVAEKWLTNTDAVNALVEPLQELYDTMTDEQEAAIEENDTRLEAINDKRDEVSELLAAVNEPVEIEKAKIAPIQDVLVAVEEAISAIITNSSNGAYGTSDIETYIRLCEDIVAKQEKAVYDAETEVMRAEKALADWNSDAKDYVTLCEEALADAQQDLKEAEEDLAQARQNLQTIIEKLAVEGDTTTGEEVTE